MSRVELPHRATATPEERPTVLGFDWTGGDLERKAAETIVSFVSAMLAGEESPRPRCAEFYHTPFARACCRALLAVPRGRTISYSALATAAGRPGAARAAGRFCSRNPLPLLVPCHRVVASGGGLGGFSAGAGWKSFLLRVERAA